LCLYLEVHLKHPCCSLLLFLISTNQFFECNQSFFSHFLIK
jgi:hypothetical protein